MSASSEQAHESPVPVMPTPPSRPRSSVPKKVYSSSTHSTGVLSEFFSETYAYREYLKQSVLRDLRNKYKRSMLGYLWTMIHPLMMMTVLTVVFSHIMKVGMKDYAVFLFSGLLPWNYFNSTCMMSLGSIRANARLFSQIPVPKFIFVLSITFSNLVNLFFALVPLLVIMLVLGHPIQWSVIAFPFILLPLSFVVVGISLILAAANVFFDDTLHLTEVGMSMLYFLSPILYDRSMLPVSLVAWLQWNPLFHIIEFFRDIFYLGIFPDPMIYLMTFCESLLILMLGLLFFRKAQDKFLYFI